MDCFKHCHIFLITVWGILFPSLQLSAAQIQSASPSSQRCVNCHSEQYQQWQQSHHFKAMAKATPETVLGNFNNVSFEYNGIKSRFFQKGKQFFVTTDNARGKQETFNISYTFGVYPLQQYLIDFDDGRKQVLNIMWDSRPSSEGGQRWYHLYPEHPSMTHGHNTEDQSAANNTNNMPAAVSHNNQPHWTKNYFNWNSRCAACHSTQVEKHYSPNSNSYKSQWREINVSCESCHGNSKNHLRWSEKSERKQTREASKGWGFSIKDEGTWSAEQTENNPSAYRTFKRKGRSANKQNTVCASCHSRRSEITTPDPYLDYNDNYILSLIESPLYYADGQIREEVYVWGSFIQSKMHHEGVTCSNCHEPHSSALKAEGNALCTQCHNREIFNTTSHHHHQENTAGSQCVNCHMTETTYMGVDTRRDHSFRIPRPVLSAQVNAPNACNQCHQQWSPEQAQQFIKQWGTNDHPQHFAIAFQAADNYVFQTPETKQWLSDIASSAQQPDIIRASALIRFTQDQDNLKIIASEITNTSPIIRLAAIRSLAVYPIQVRYNMLSKKLDNPTLPKEKKAIRIEIARQLAGLPLVSLNVHHAEQVRSLNHDFLKYSQFNADLPESQIMLGNFHLNNNAFKKAEKAYLHALLLDDDSIAAMVNLAELYRQTQRDHLAEPLLQKAITQEPNDASHHYAIGLLYIRQNQLELALSALEKASNLHYSHPVFAYTYALALQKKKQDNLAKDYLVEWVKTHGEEPQVMQVLNSLH
ncbi:cytochrome c3 family protein [Photobacterium minamisatsumaniensis]|uniref:cytochrome c3 family protein n=1 Tax=Photobacterium minamisatsumaniensis TaxID=2910233 RepID=UPI003D0BF69D